ncbi:MAG TPA: carboxypeptidase-like regulatory domain-containing protein [Pirellulales bacterium]
MRRRAVLQTVLVSLAVFGLLAPPPVRAATAGAPTPATARPVASESMIADVTLQGSSELTGHVVGADGNCVAHETVYLLRQGAVVGTCQTDAVGRFAIVGLSGGVYEVGWAYGVTACRLWAPQTAPPSAKTELLLTANAPVVRGQTGSPHPGRSWLKGPIPWIAAGVVGVGAIIWDVVTAQKHRYERDHPQPPAS